MDYSLAIDIAVEAFAHHPNDEREAYDFIGEWVARSIDDDSHDIIIDKALEHYFFLREGV